MVVHPVGTAAIVGLRSAVIEATSTSPAFVALGFVSETAVAAVAELVVVDEPTLIPAGATSDSSENQYLFVTSLLARITTPDAALTDCLLLVALFRFDEAEFLITGVPRPATNDRLLIDEVFSKIVPAEPVKAHPV